MADVHVTVKNKSGKTVTLLLDDERDAERIAYLKRGVGREDFESFGLKSAAQVEAEAKRAAEAQAKADEAKAKAEAEAKEKAEAEAKAKAAAAK